MYLTHSQKAKAAICYIAATFAHMGNFNFQPDTTVITSLCVHHYLLQEVTMTPAPTLTEKAAGATAASSAQMSALLGDFIVPPLRRNAMGFCSFLPTITLLKPLPAHKTFPTPV